MTQLMKGDGIKRNDKAGVYLDHNNVKVMSQRLLTFQNLLEPRSMQSQDQKGRLTVL